jgi:hypothetical protein
MTSQRNISITSKILLTAPGCFDYPHIYMDEHAKDFRLQREVQKRVCMCCEKEEETTWDKDFFYCSECRAKYRSASPSPAEDEAPALKATLAPSEA